MSAPAVSPLTIEEQPDHEAIARLAYSFWEMRAMENMPGSAEEDWFRAEQELGNSAA